MLKEKYKLTTREGEVLKCIQLAMTNKEISQELEITVETVKSHVKAILEKLDVNDRKKLIAFSEQYPIH